MSTDPARPARLWPWLLGLGLLGTLSLLLAPFERVLPAPIPAWQLRLLVMSNPLPLLAVAVPVGIWAARRAGFDAPLLRALVRGEPIGGIAGRQLRAALPGALAAGLCLLVYNLTIARHVGDGAAAARAAVFTLPVPTRILYGGLAEEVISRWGLMSLLVLAASALLGKRAGVWTGLVIAAVLFSLGHLPLARILLPAASAAVFVMLIVANAVAGLVFGWLFWRRGLESAMMAHALAHIVAVAVALLI